MSSSSSLSPTSVVLVVVYECDEAPALEGAARCSRAFKSIEANIRTLKINFYRVALRASEQPRETAGSGIQFSLFSSSSSSSMLRCRCSLVRSLWRNERGSEAGIETK